MPALRSRPRNGPNHEAAAPIAPQPPALSRPRKTVEEIAGYPPIGPPRFVPGGSTLTRIGQLFNPKLLQYHQLPLLLPPLSLTALVHSA
jgi:hypothetical protein